MSFRFIALPVCAVAIALLVGCGGSSDAGEISTTSLAKVHFVQKADAICTNGLGRIETDFAEVLEDIKEEHKNLRNPSHAQYVEVVETILVPNIEEELKEIRELDPPSGDGDQVEGILTAIEEGIESAKEEPKSAVVGGFIFAKSSKLAKEYEFQTCGQEPQSMRDLSAEWRGGR